MDELNLDLDFSGVTKPSMGMGITFPPRDFYIATVKEYKLFDESGSKKLYAYLQTEKGVISDNFRIGNEIDMQRLAGHLISIGVAPNKVLGAKGQVPFHKFIGKKSHIFYTPPLLQPNGQKVEGSWPKTKYFSAEEWKAAKEAEKGNEPEEAVQNAEQAKAEPKAEPKADTIAKSSDDSGDWLT